MALSLSNFLTPILALLLYVLSSQAATVTYDFNITWTTANPDGAFERTVMGINGVWPPPVMYANKGDQVVVNVYNDLKNTSTSLHFHGIFQTGTTDMDGSAGVSQCEIGPGSRFTYNFTVSSPASPHLLDCVGEEIASIRLKFTAWRSEYLGILGGIDNDENPLVIMTMLIFDQVNQPGTYWYHSHVKGQYPDGLRAPFVIHDPDMPFKDLYKDEIILTFSDWYHDTMPTLLKQFISYANPTGAEPVPEAALMNDTQGLKINVQPNTTYLFRMVNMGAFAAQHVWFEGHTMRIVEVDGVYTDPTDANMLYITVAQRYSVLITTKNDTSANFPISGSMDEVRPKFCTIFHNC
jgi:iron transport multicopper oxidase